MAKKAPGRLNKTRVRYDRLDKLIKDLGKKVSIKVGIIGEKAAEIHKDSGLTNAQLGAIHEFGANIPVTPEMRGWFYHNFEINKSNNAIVIPTRSFLRMPLLNENGQTLKKEVVKELNKNLLSTDRELNAAGGVKLLESAVHALAESALLRVQEAFDTGGFGQWSAISEFTRQNRKYNPEGQPLTDSGQLKQSITYEIKGL